MKPRNGIHEFGLSGGVLIAVGAALLACLFLTGNVQARSPWRLRVAVLSDHLGHGAVAPVYIDELRKKLSGSSEIKAWVVRDCGGLPPAKVLGSIEEYLPQVMIVTLGSDELTGGRISASSSDRFIREVENLAQMLAALPTGPRVLVAPPIIPRGIKTKVSGELVKSTREAVKKACGKLWKNKHNVGSLTLNPGDTEGEDLGRFIQRTTSLIRRSFQKTEEGATVSRGTRRTLEEIDQFYAKIPSVEFSPPSGRWNHLPQTRKRLVEGGRLRIVMLGDSIVNDTARSSYPLMLEKAQPNRQIELVTSVRGSTGCWWYQENDRVKWMVLDQGPDLLIIGGISQRKDVGAIQRVIEQMRAEEPEAEVLLMSGTFGRVDPLNENVWNEIQDPGTRAYRTQLRELADQLGVAYFDMRLAWATYVRESGRSTDSFHRDPVHANAEGEQILGRLMESFLTP